MIYIYFVDSVRKDLRRLKKDPRLTSGMKDQIQILEQELELLVLYMFSLIKWNDSSFGRNKDSGLAEISCTEATVEKKGLLEAGVLALDSGEFQDWDILSSELFQEIQLYKPTITEDCLNFFDCLFQCEFSTDELQKLMRYTSASLSNLLLLKGDTVLDEKLKIESLKEKLDLFKEVFKFTMKRCSSYQEMENFRIQIQASVCNAACLCLLNWVLDEKEESVASIVNDILSDLRRKINASTPELTRMCLAVLKASKPSADDGFEVGELVSKFVEFLLGNSHVDLPEDDIQMLRNGLIFLITFIMDPPEAKEYAKDRKLILTQAAAVVNEAASLISSLSDEERNFLIHDFLEKVNVIEAEVRIVYSDLFLDPSCFNFPTINILGFFDSLLKSLKEISVHFSKHQIVILQQELLSLRDFLKESNLKECSILELRKENKELKDLWIQIVNIAHQAERIISSFVYMNNYIWLEMLWFFDVTKAIELVKGEVKGIQDQHVHDIDALEPETSSSVVLLQAHDQTTDEVFVGLDDEVKEIIDRLERGSKELDIISIVGMPGIGKTTFAKKVYNDPSVQYHFNKFAWCTVSQSYNSKKLLLDILHDVTIVDDSFFKMEEEELADRLRKCLKGQKYLIVMDDIWDVSAWDTLKLSFPDDNNASRIMFTSRIHNMVLEAKSNSCPYHLSPLSDEESWELLEKRLFYTDRCPPNFVEVGKQTAKNCEGLPLAIVLVAGLLKEKVGNLKWWNQIRESLGSQISKEGCADVLELSYKHLPEPLKPCFLYFGLFQEGEHIRARKLAQLWVSEGFIEKQEMKNFENVAMEYLIDLVARSLIIVTDKTSTGGIKACRIHDLLREFCLAKGEEENFFKLVHGNNVSQFSRAAMDKQYRVSIQTTRWRSFLVWNSSALHSLLFSPPYTFNAFDIDDCHLSNSKFLQVLDLEDVMFCGEFPEEITELVLLRYLAISFVNKTSIPRSIIRLQNLETLRARIIDSLPSTMWEMEKLRHVKIGFCIRPYLPDNISALKNVRSFSSPNFIYGEAAERFLRKIPTVQKLGFLFESMGHFKEGNRILKLDFLSCLESLNLIYTGKKLYGNPLSLPLSLKKLTFSGFSLPWTEISTIAKFPNLEVLKLEENAFKGKTWNMEDEEFLKLKFLKLEELDIKQWNASDDAFPCLERLVVKHCYKLEEIPSAFGNIPTLRMIQVRSCRSTAARSALKIQEEQLDLGNDLEVLAAEIEDLDPSIRDSDEANSKDEMDSLEEEDSSDWMDHVERILQDSSDYSDEIDHSDEVEPSDEE